MDVRKLFARLCLFFLLLESVVSDGNVKTTNAFSKTSGTFTSSSFGSLSDESLQQNGGTPEQTDTNAEKPLKEVLAKINAMNKERNNTSAESNSSQTNSDETKEKLTQITPSPQTESSTTTTTFSSSWSSSSSSSRGEVYSSSYLPTSSYMTEPPEEERCYTDAVLQNFCPVTNDMTDVSFWDLYSILFSDTAIDALIMGCSRGSWCLRDRFDYWDALIAERVDMIMVSDISTSMCHSEMNPCITKTVQNFKNCSMYPQMEFAAEALLLICKLKQNPSLTDTCYKHVITALHVSLADIMRKDDYEELPDDMCQRPEAYMTGGLICVENSCPDEFDTFESFKPWAWFTSVVIELIEECGLDPKKCRALLQPPPPGYLYGSELSTMVGVSIAITVSVLLFTITTCVCYKRYRRNAVIKDGYQKLLNDGDES
ncbi:hypothetical protein ACF0H5_018867 [Mactra antiquata]